MIKKSERCVYDIELSERLRKFFFMYVCVYSVNRLKTIQTELLFFIRSPKGLSLTFKSFDISGFRCISRSARLEVLSKPPRGHVPSLLFYNSARC